MSKIIKTGSDSRAKLLNGATQLADAVVATLGPNGRNVVIAQKGGNLPTSTKNKHQHRQTHLYQLPINRPGGRYVNYRHPGPRRVWKGGRSSGK